MTREDACKNLDAAISEIQYSITAKHSKSEIEHEHYLRNAIRFIEEAKELTKEGGGMSEDSLQNNKCFIDWRGYGEDSEPYCEPCDIELFDEWNHCPSCGRKIYSYIDGKEIVGWP